MGKVPRKILRKIPGKILQNLYSKRSPTHFCRGAGANIFVPSEPNPCDEFNCGLLGFCLVLHAFWRFWGFGTQIHNFTFSTPTTALSTLQELGNGPNTVSESTVSNTELSEFFGPHRAPRRKLSEFRSAYYPCAKANSPSFSQKTHRVRRWTQWVLSSEAVLSKQYSACFLKNVTF